MDYLTISEKRHPIRWGMTALAEFSELAGISLIDLANPAKFALNMTPKQCLQMVWVGLECGAQKVGQPNAFASWQQLGDALDDPETDAMTVLQSGVQKLFTQTTAPPAKKKPQEGSEEEGKQEPDPENQ